MSVFLYNGFMLKKILFILIIIFSLFSNSFIDNSSILYADHHTDGKGFDAPKDKKPATPPAAPAEGSKESGNQQRIEYKHDCETNKNRQTPTSLASGGVLRYDIDCAPFHHDGILDLTGRHSWSIVGWIQRLLIFAYRLAFGFAVAALLWASVSYFRAGIAGGGGMASGYEAAKTMLSAALVGILIASKPSLS
jgi:hypothetical protein